MYVTKMLKAKRRPSKSMSRTIPTKDATWSQERAGRVLDLAANLFMKYGYDGVSMQMIVADTGGSYRDLYRQFGDKTSMFRQVVAKTCDVVLAPIRAISRSTNETEMAVEPALTELGLSYLNRILSAQVLALDRLIIAEAVRFPELPEIFMSSGPSVAYRDVSRLLVKLFGASGITLDDPKLAAKLFLHMIQSDLHLRALTGSIVSSVEIEASVRIGVRIFVAGIRSTQPTTLPVAVRT